MHRTHYVFSPKRRHYFDHLEALKTPEGWHISDPRNIARICKQASEAAATREHGMATKLGISRFPHRGEHNHCAGCMTPFNSTTAFERHRTGAGSAGRCMTRAEMLGRGMVRLANGYWGRAARKHRAGPGTVSVMAEEIWTPPPPQGVPSSGLLSAGAGWLGPCGAPAAPAAASRARATPAIDPC